MGMIPILRPTQIFKKRVFEIVRLYYLGDAIFFYLMRNPYFKLSESSILCAFNIEMDASDSNSDFVDFTKQLELLEKNYSANLLEQLPGYNYQETNLFIDNLAIELEQQKTLQVILSSHQESIDSQIESITKFSNHYQPIIETQEAQIKKLSQELKMVVNDNKEMMKSQEQIQSLQQKPFFIQLAENMKEMKRAKQEIKHFLETMGIVSPPLPITSEN